MSDEAMSEQADNVIRVDFGAPRRAASATGEGQGAAITALRAEELDPMAQKKLEIFERFIEKGMVSVTLDPRASGVSVPDAFAARSELILNFSHRFFIEDFTFDLSGIAASLSFSGRPFYCVIPWGAVKMLLSHHDNAAAVFDPDMLY